MKLPSLKNSLSVFLATVYFTGQVVLAHAAESNIWEERRTFAQTARASAGKPRDNVQLAQLPANFPPIRPSLPTVPTFIKPDLKNSPRFSPPVQELVNGINQLNGSIQDIFDSGDKTHPPVALIQDIHLNAEAQTNIAAVLQNLIDQKLVGVIGVEGAFGPFDLKPFREFPNKQITNDVAQAFLDKGLMAAPSYVGLTSETEPPLLLGVDDREHYDANVNAYLDAKDVKEKVAKELRTAKQKLLEEKKRVLSPELKRFDELRGAYHKGDIGFGKYVENLSSVINNRSSIINRSLMTDSKWSMTDLGIQQFLSAYAMEQSLDFTRVEHERRRVIEKLTQTLSKKEIDDLLAHSMAYKMGQIGFGAYYQWLKELCQIKNIDLRQTPAFENYIRYVLLSDGIKAEKLFESVAKLEEDIAERLAVTPEEKQLIAQSEQLVLTEKLINFELTPVEWQKYLSLRAKRSNLSQQEIAKRNLASERQIASVAPSGLPRNDNLNAFEQFYEEADIRTQKMVENLDSRTQRALSHHNNYYGVGRLRGNDTAALVVGGFHTSDLTRLLREKKTSYVVVSPKITKIDTQSGSAYLSVFSREKTPLDKLFEGKKLSVNPEVNVSSPKTGVPTLSAMMFRLKKINPVQIFWNKMPIQVTVPSDITLFNKYKISQPWQQRLWTAWRYFSFMVRTQWEIIFPLLIPAAQAVDSYFSLGIPYVGIAAWGISAVVFAWSHPDFTWRRFAILTAVGLVLGAPFLSTGLNAIEAKLWSMGLHAGYTAFVLALRGSRFYFLRAIGYWLPLASIVNSSNVPNLPYGFPRLFSHPDELDAYFNFLQSRSKRYRETLLYESELDDEMDEMDEKGGFIDGIERLSNFIVSNPRYLRLVIENNPKNYQKISRAWKNANPKKKYMKKSDFSFIVSSLDQKRPTEMMALLKEHPELLVPVFERDDESFSISTNVLRIGADLRAEIDALRNRTLGKVKEALNWAKRQWTVEQSKREKAALQKKMLAYLKLKRERTGRISKDDIKNYLKSNEVKFNEFEEFSESDKIEALFVTLVQNQFPSPNIIDAIYAYGLNDSPIKTAFEDEEQPERAVTALEQIINDRFKNHLLVNTHIKEADLPSKVLEDLGKSRSGTARLLKAMGQSVHDDETHLIWFDPMGFEAGYRGHLGEDCTKCVSDNAFAALHPANHYYRPRNFDGYIGFTEAHVEGHPELKFVAIDTIQSPDSKIPSKAIPEIISEIENWAKKKGFIGAALPLDLAPSFNHEQVRDQIKAMDSYTRGQIVFLEAEHPEATELLEKEQNVYPSQSIKNMAFVVLSPLSATAHKKIQASPLSDEQLRSLSKQMISLNNYYQTFPDDLDKFRLLTSDWLEFFGNHPFPQSQQMKMFIVDKIVALHRQSDYGAVLIYEGIRKTMPDKGIKALRKYKDNKLSDVLIKLLFPNEDLSGLDFDLLKFFCVSLIDQSEGWDGLKSKIDRLLILDLKVGKHHIRHVHRIFEFLEEELENDLPSPPASSKDSQLGGRILWLRAIFVNWLGVPQAWYDRHLTWIENGLAMVAGVVVAAVIGSSLGVPLESFWNDPVLAFGSSFLLGWVLFLAAHIPFFNSGLAPPQYLRSNFQYAFQIALVNIIILLLPLTLLVFIPWVHLLPFLKLWLVVAHGFFWKTHDVVNQEAKKEPTDIGQTQIDIYQQLREFLSSRFTLTTLVPLLESYAFQYGLYDTLGSWGVALVFAGVHIVLLILRRGVKDVLKNGFTRYEISHMVLWFMLGQGFTMPFEWELEHAFETTVLMHVLWNDAVFKLRANAAAGDKFDQWLVRWLPLASILPEAPRHWYRRSVHKEMSVSEAMRGILGIRGHLPEINAQLIGDQQIPLDELEESEITNYGRAVKYLNERRNKRVNEAGLEQMFLNINSLLYPGSSRLRPRENEELHRLVRSLFSDDFEAAFRKNPISVAARVFARFNNLQVFSEGNSRSSFLLMNYVLMKAGASPVLLNRNNILDYRRLKYAENGRIKVKAAAMRSFLEDHLDSPVARNGNGNQLPETRTRARKETKGKSAPFEAAVKTETAYEEPNRIIQDYAIVDENLGILIVADGMGGEKNAAEASRRAAEEVYRLLQERLSKSKNNIDIEAIIERAIREASLQIRIRQEETKSEMDTTIVVAVLRGNKLIGRKVGDSRLYRRDITGRISVLGGHDDSLVGESVARGLLSAAAAEKNLERHILTDAVGNIRDSFKEHQKIEETIMPGDIFFAVTDGVIDNLLGDGIRLAAKNNDTPQKLVAALVNGALKVTRSDQPQANPDDITAIAMRARPAKTAAVFEPRSKSSARPDSQGGPASILDAQAKARWGENSWKYWLYTVFGVNWEAWFQLLIPLIMLADPTLIGLSTWGLTLIAWGVSAGLFAVFHPNRTPGRMLNLFLVGLALGAPLAFSPLAFYWNTLISMALHSIYNALALKFGWTVASIVKLAGHREIQFQIDPEGNLFIFGARKDPVIYSLDKLKKIADEGEEIFFGRSPDGKYTTVIEDISGLISKNHFKIWPVITDDSIIFWIQDTHSKHGTKLSSGDSLEGVLPKTLIHHTRKNRLETFRYPETGENAGIDGHQINGTKSEGRGGDREILVMDRSLDKKLDGLIIKIEKAINESRSEELTGLEKAKFISQIIATNQVLIPRPKTKEEWKKAEEKLNTLVGKYRGKRVLFGDFSLDEKLGVCRHHGLLAAIILESLIHKGILNGRVYYVRGPGHGWALYVTSEGKKWVIDIAQGYSGPTQVSGKDILYRLEDGSTYSYDAYTPSHANLKINKGPQNSSYATVVPYNDDMRRSSGWDQPIAVTPDSFVDQPELNPLYTTLVNLEAERQLLMEIMNDPNRKEGLNETQTRLLMITEDTLLRNYEEIGLIRPVGYRFKINRFWTMYDDFLIAPLFGTKPDGKPFLRAEILDEAGKILKRQMDNRKSPINIDNAWTAFSVITAVSAIGSFFVGDTAGTILLSIPPFFFGLALLPTIFRTLSNNKKGPNATGPPKSIYLWGKKAIPSSGADFIEWDHVAGEFLVNPILYNLLTGNFLTRFLTYFLLNLFFVPFHELTHPNGMHRKPLTNEVIGFGAQVFFAASLITLGVTGLVPFNILIGGYFTVAAIAALYFAWNIRSPQEHFESLRDLIRTQNNSHHTGDWDNDPLVTTVRKRLAELIADYEKLPLEDREMERLKDFVLANNGAFPFTYDELDSLIPILSDLFNRIDVGAFQDFFGEDPAYLYWVGLSGTMHPALDLESYSGGIIKKNAPGYREKMSFLARLFTRWRENQWGIPDSHGDVDRAQQRFIEEIGTPYGIVLKGLDLAPVYTHLLIEILKMLPDSFLRNLSARLDKIEFGEGSHIAEYIGKAKLITVTSRSYTIRQFTELLLHELGHVALAGLDETTRAEFDVAFKKARMKKAIPAVGALGLSGTERHRYITGGRENEENFCEGFMHFVLFGNEMAQGYPTFLNPSRQDVWNPIHGLYEKHLFSQEALRLSSRRLGAGSHPGAHDAQGGPAPRSLGEGGISQTVKFLFFTLPMWLLMKMKWVNQSTVDRWSGYYDRFIAPVLENALVLAGQAYLMDGGTSAMNAGLIAWGVFFAVHVVEWLFGKNSGKNVGWATLIAIAGLTALYFFPFASFFSTEALPYLATIFGVHVAVNNQTQSNDMEKIFTAMAENRVTDAVELMLGSPNLNIGAINGDPRTFILKGKEDEGVIIAAILKTGLRNPTRLVAEKAYEKDYLRVAAALNKLGGNVTVATYVDESQVGISKNNVFNPDSIPESYREQALGTKNLQNMAFILSNGLTSQWKNVRSLDDLIPRAERRNLNNLKNLVQKILVAA